MSVGLWARGTVLLKSCEDLHFLSFSIFYRRRHTIASSNVPISILLSIQICSRILAKCKKTNRKNLKDVKERSKWDTYHVNKYGGEDEQLRGDEIQNP